MKFKNNKTKLLPKIQNNKTNLESFTIETARKHFGSKLLHLKNAIGDNSKILKPKEAKELETIKTIEGFIGKIGQKQFVASALENDNSAFDIFVFEKPNYPLFSIEQNQDNLSFFEIEEKIYMLNAYKIYNTNELNYIWLSLSLKTA